MNLADIPLAAKIGAGAIAGLALLGGGAAAGAHLGGGAQASATNPIVASPASGPSARPSPGADGAANQAVRRAALQAEAQVLGVSLQQLNADFKAGKTVQQLAADKGLSQDQFRARFHQAVQAQLARAVAAGTLTPDQEQRALTRLDASIPNWSQVGQGAKARPSPTPTP